jgi:hypothetical protein
MMGIWVIDALKDVKIILKIQKFINFDESVIKTKGYATIEFEYDGRCYKLKF